MNIETQYEQGILKFFFKCSDHEANSGNSDAKCFDEEPIFSIRNLIENPHLCNLCPYNSKYKNMSYKEWKEFKEENKL